MAAAPVDVKTEPKDAKSEIKEAKTEGKQVVEENPQPLLKYKRLVLKVSIHCKGCQNKVQRILRDIDGVYTTDIDLRQQKVTVTGNVEAETLIKKLVQRTGKHAELWPEKTDQKQSKSKTKEKEKEKSKQSDEETDEEDTEKEEEIVKVNENGCKQKTVVACKAREGGGCGCVIGKGGVKEPKTEQKQHVSNQSQPVVGEKKVVFISGGESEAGNNVEKGSSSNGGTKKKKKKKGHKKSVNIEEFDQSANTVPACTESAQFPCPANHSPPHNPYQYPGYANYYVPPVYAVKYNTSQPSSSYASSYYAAPAPYSSYANYHERPDFEIDTSPPRQSGSFEMFSDENPNACSVM